MDIDKLITEALDKVNKENENSRIGKDTDRELPIAMLLNIKLELTKMLEILDKTKYQPSYPRFLLDYPDTKLADILLNVSYKYKKMT